MTDQEFVDTLRGLMRVVVDLDGLELEAFMRRLGGPGEPAPDPKLFRWGGEALATVRTMAADARRLQEAYLQDPQHLLPIVMDAYTPEERARAGIV